MKKRYISIAMVLVLVLSVFAFAGCSSNDDSNDNEQETTSVNGNVMVAAAASLENTLVDKLIPMFNEQYTDVKVEGTYDSSGKLQEQIEGGLEASIFMSAATKQMDDLVKGEFIDQDNVVNALENEVVLIKSKQRDTTVDSFENINDAEKIAIGDPASVPAGQYAEEILKNLNVWDQVEGKASLGTNVTEVLNWVAEGSVDVGIVYKTDAESIADKVDIIEVAPEDSLDTPVIYPIGLLNNIAEENKEAADKFMEFLQSEEALKVFEESGFKIVK